MERVGGGGEGREEGKRRGRWKEKKKVEGDSEEGEMRGEEGRREGKRGERGKGEEGKGKLLCAYFGELGLVSKLHVPCS